MHISREELDKFRDNSMNTQEMIAFLEHMDQCNYCLAQMLEEEDSLPAVQAPVYLKEQILTKATTPAIRAGKTVHTASYRMQLLYCGLKTAVGVMTALFLLFSVTKVDFAGLVSTASITTELPERIYMPEKHPDYLGDFSRKISHELTESSRALTGYLNDFSNKIINGGK